MCLTACAKSGCNHCVVLQHLVHEPRGIAERKSVAASPRALLDRCFGLQPWPRQAPARGATLTRLRSGVRVGQPA